MLRVKMWSIAAFAVCATVVGRVYALDPAPKPAKELIDAAESTAAKLHKPIFVLFEQSKCAWCKRLDVLVNRPELKKTIDANYVLLRLDVLEGGDAIKLHENAGGSEFMAKLGGGKEIPFFAWVDARGKLIANSIAMPGGANLGYPASPQQIDVFVGLIKKTAPHCSAADLKTMRDYLIANPPK